MTITFEAEIRKGEITNLSEFAREVQKQGEEIGRESVRQFLEQYDQVLLAERDKNRYRSKGLRTTSIKTRLGVIEYQRRVYQDLQAEEGKRCVYLLDDVIQRDGVGLYSRDICELAVQFACQGSYRDAARQISDATGLQISHQSVWNIVQRMGERERKRVSRHTELMQAKQGVGTIETPLLYEENDGIWLHMQGKDRAFCGKSKEMKVGIAYDGVLWKKKDGVVKRRELDEKVAFASFESAKEFENHKKGVISSRYDLDSVELLVKNGDGANWIQKNAETNTITVLDEFHRNKKLTECVWDKEFAQVLRGLLFAKDVDGLLACLEAQITTLSVVPGRAEEVEKLMELQRYYTENKASLLGYYDRGVEIPPTRKPGVIHHARLGSMESNVFTLIGNRMKGRRHCWSVAGANNLGLLLCEYHTTGLGRLHAPLPNHPVREEPWVDPGRPLSHREAMEKVGRGYEYPRQAEISASCPFMRFVLRSLPFGELKL